MAASMRAEGTSFGGNVALDLAVYDYARSVGNMEIMNKYADALYDSSGEYLDADLEAIWDFLVLASGRIEKSTNGDSGGDHYADMRKAIGDERLFDAFMSAMTGGAEGISEELNAKIVAATGGLLNPLAIMNGGAKAVIKIDELISSKETDKPDSRILAKNIKATGEKRPVLSATHHIVAGGAPDAESARDLLKGFGIGINDADNGVFLASNKVTALLTGSQTAVHSALHTKTYYDTVNEMLSFAKNEAEARAILRDIKNKLLSGGL
jgi:hypothetical protein